MNVTGNSQEVSVILDEEGLETALKKMTASSIAHIEITRVGDAEPLHAFREIRPVCTNQEVVVIIHEHISDNVNIKPLMHATQYVQKRKPILLILNDRTPFVASRKDVVECPFVFYAPLSGHKKLMLQLKIDQEKESGGAATLLTAECRQR